MEFILSVLLAYRYAFSAGAKSDAIAISPSKRSQGDILNETEHSPWDLQQSREELVQCKNFPNVYEYYS